MKSEEEEEENVETRIGLVMQKEEVEQKTAWLWRREEVSLLYSVYVVSLDSPLNILLRLFVNASLTLLLSLFATFALVLHEHSVISHFGAQSLHEQFRALDSNSENSNFLNVSVEV